MTHAQYDCDLIAKQKDELIIQQAAVIEQMREALQVAERNNPDKVLVTVFSKALALQPCPEVLNKAQADAERWRLLAHMEASRVAPDVIASYIARPDRLDYAVSLRKQEVAIDAIAKENGK